MGNKLCISVNIYHRILKLGMSTHVFKISLYYDKKWEIKLCSKLTYAMIKTGRKSFVSQLISIIDF